MQALQQCCFQGVAKVLIVVVSALLRLCVVYYWSKLKDILVSRWGFILTPNINLEFILTAMHHPSKDYFLFFSSSVCLTLRWTPISTMTQQHSINTACWHGAAKDAGKHQTFFWQRRGQRGWGWGGWGGEIEESKTKWDDRYGRKGTPEPGRTQGGRIQTGSRCDWMAERRETTEGWQSGPKRNPTFTQSADALSSDNQSAAVSPGLDQSAGPAAYDGAEHDHSHACRRPAPPCDRLPHRHTGYQTNGLCISVHTHSDILTNCTREWPIIISTTFLLNWFNFVYRDSR